MWKKVVAGMLAGGRVKFDHVIIIMSTFFAFILYPAVSSLFLMLVSFYHFLNLPKKKTEHLPQTFISNVCLYLRFLNLTFRCLKYERSITLVCKGLAVMCLVLFIKYKEGRFKTFS